MRTVAVCVMLFGATGAAAAPADAVHARISGLRELGAAFKSMNDMLRGGAPASILVQQTARQISNAAAQMPGWFPRGSGTEAGVKTAARPEIWSEPSKFSAAQSAFIAQAAKLRAAAEKNDLAAVRNETRALGATCKSCHDSFRVPST